MSDHDSTKRTGPSSLPDSPKGKGVSMSFGLPANEQDLESGMRMSMSQPEVKPLPFRIVVVDDFCGDASGSARPNYVTAGTIDDAMDEHGVSATIVVPNHFQTKPSELTVVLSFRAMRDFRPKQLLAQVPELRAAHAAYESLVNYRAGRLTAAQLDVAFDPIRVFDAFDPAFEAMSVRPRSSVSGGESAEVDVASDEQSVEGRKLLDELLGGSSAALPPEPENHLESSGSALDGVIDSITSGKRNVNKEGASQALAHIEKLLRRQLDEVLSAPVVRSLECAWRGLQMIALQAAGGGVRAVRVEFLHAPASNLGDVFSDGVYQPECAGESDDALSLIVSGHAVRNTAVDLDALTGLQEMAEDLQAPILWSMAPSFFGGSARDLAARDSLRSILDSDDLAKWRGLRGKDASRWSGACFNRFLLRTPHQVQIGSWAYNERAENALFGAPSFLVASLIARSVVDAGWPTRFAGLRDGCLEGLALVDHLPVEGQFSEAAVEDLAERGVMALTCVSGRDQVLLLRAPCVHEAAQFGSRTQQNAESRLMSSLPYQLLAARIAAATILQKESLVSDGANGNLRQRFEMFLGALLGDTGTGASVFVSTEQDQEHEGSQWVHCSLRTGAAVLVGAEIKFSLRV